MENHHQLDQKNWKIKNLHYVLRLEIEILWNS